MTARPMTPSEAAAFFLTTAALAGVALGRGRL
jgi:hypothetical protein